MIEDGKAIYSIAADEANADWIRAAGLRHAPTQEMMNPHVNWMIWKMPRYITRMKRRKGNRMGEP